MNFPEKYDWLNRETAPGLLMAAKKLYGTKEIQGPKHNPTIMGWIKKLAFSWLKSDEEPWCGTSMAYAAIEAGVAIRNPEMPRAFWWLNWGAPATVPMLGDVLVFTISHVGIYVGEDATHYHVLGGNQGNEYGIARFPKSWLKGARRTVWKIAQPRSIRRVYLKSDGTPTNVGTR